MPFVYEIGRVGSVCLGCERIFSTCFECHLENNLLFGYSLIEMPHIWLTQCTNDLTHLYWFVTFGVTF